MEQSDSNLTLRDITIARICEIYSCSEEAAIKYLDLKEEGYSKTQALLMAGISDPPEP